MVGIDGDEHTMVVMFAVVEGEGRIPEDQKLYPVESS